MTFNARWLEEEEEKDENKIDEQWLQQINIGHQLDVLNVFGKWCTSYVDNLRSNHIHVVFTNMPVDYAEWIHIESQRLAPVNTQAYNNDPCIDIGQRVQIRTENVNKWQSAYIVCASERRIQVRFEGQNSSFDTWIELHPNCVKPIDIHLRNTQNIRRRRRQYKMMKNSINTRKLLIANPQFEHYNQGLSNLSLQVVSVLGDGNCLFRSISHQVYGTDSHHAIVRGCCMDYMENEKQYFEPYIEGNMDDFIRYIQEKRRDAVWGDDPEIQAMCELYDRPAEIYTYDAVLGARKLRTFHEQSSLHQRHRPIRLSYYGGGHYDSIIPSPNDMSYSQEVPGTMERRRIALSAAATIRTDDVVQTALELSRNLFDAQNNDMETILQSSLDEFNRFQISQVQENSELVAMQSQMIEAAKKQSEEEDIQKAISESLMADCSTNTQTDMDTAIQASLLEEDIQKAISESLMADCSTNTHLYSTDRY